MFSIVTSTPVLPSFRLASGADSRRPGVVLLGGRGGARLAQRRGGGQRTGAGPEEAATVDLSGPLRTLILHGTLLSSCRHDRAMRRPRAVVPQKCNTQATLIDADVAVEQKSRVNVRAISRTGAAIPVRFGTSCAQSVHGSRHFLAAHEGDIP